MSLQYQVEKILNTLKIIVFFFRKKKNSETDKNIQI